MTCDETKILDFNLANTTVKDEENLQSCSPFMDKTINELTQVLEGLQENEEGVKEVESHKKDETRQEDEEVQDQN